MIELYAKGTTDFSARGIALAAQQAAVTYQENGRFDMDLTMTYDGRITIDYGMILRCPVPVQEVGTITLGQVSYWEVSAGQSDVKLYKTVPSSWTIIYEQWQYGREYQAGHYVTYMNKNYRAAHDITGKGTTVVPGTDAAWTQVPRT
jgi:hypothetical protein